MTGHSRKFVALAILAVAGVLLAGCSRHPANPPPRPAVPAGQLGSRLPEFSVTDLQGRPLSSADLRGKVVLVDFWATWCAPCRKEMPGYQKLQDEYGSQGFQV